MLAIQSHTKAFITGVVGERWNGRYNRHLPLALNTNNQTDTIQIVVGGR